MIKQGYEDFKRHRNDRVINHRLITKLESGGVREIKSQEVLFAILYTHTINAVHILWVFLIVAMVSFILR